VQDLGFDTAVNYRDDGFGERLGAAAPDGIDIYYENVGGKVFEVVLDRLNIGARIPVCGQIAHYNAAEPPSGPNLMPKLMNIVLRWRVTIRGFIIFDHAAREPDFLRDMSEWVRSGAVKVKEDIVDGLENAPRAFQGLLRGENFGKLVVRVSDDPTR
jgi:NADPH-dependent curcumin reductase CurA